MEQSKVRTRIKPGHRTFGADLLHDGKKGGQTLCGCATRGATAISGLTSPNCSSHVLSVRLDGNNTTVPTLKSAQNCTVVQEVRIAASSPEKAVTQTSTIRSHQRWIAPKIENCFFFRIILRRFLKPRLEC